MINFYFWSPSHLISWFNKDWHLEICDSSWLDWFFGLNIHLSFSITFDISTPRLMLPLLWCMIHRGQVLINSSSTTIMSHISLHVLHRLTYEKLFLWSSCFHRYSILRSNTWSIISWLLARHKCWTKLISILFLFICFFCLAWHRFFNMKLFIDWLYILITWFHLLYNCTSSDVSINTFILFHLEYAHTLNKNISPSIKLSFNTSNSTRGLYALSDLLHHRRRQIPPKSPNPNST
jgi:hypothetical protein